MYKIEQKVPIPTQSKRRPFKYPWAGMKVGDSFFVPAGNITSLRSVASRTGTIYKKQFTVRSVEGGVRVWRVK